MRSTSSALALLAAALPAAAQPVDGSRAGAWLDLLAPDRVLESVIRQGLLVARTQADLTYGDLSVSLTAGEVRLTDLTVWPFLDWDEDGACEIAVSEIVLGLPPLGTLDRADLRLDVSEVDLPLACLPPEQRTPAVMAGLQTLALPHVGVDLTYDVPSAAAEMSVEADVTGVAVLGVDARFDYLWFEVPEEGDPLPVAYLERGVIALEDDGALGVALAALPPELREPETAAAFLAGMFRSLPDADDAGVIALSEEAAAAWTALVDGSQSRLELRLAPAEPVYLSPEGWESPADAIAELRPSIAAGRVAPPDRIAPGALEAALADPDSVLPAEARRIGRALLTGVGAPRDRAAAVRFLSGRSIEDPATRLLAAEALRGTDPEGAYLQALAAAAGGAPGSVSLLDGIEAEIGLARALALQPGLEAAEGAEGMARMRALVSGRGATRSYAAAGVLARLAAAEGEPGAAAALRRLDRIGASDPAAWAPVEADAAARARARWAAGD